MTNAHQTEQNTQLNGSEVHPYIAVWIWGVAEVVYVAHTNKQSRVGTGVSRPSGGVSEELTCWYAMHPQCSGWPCRITRATADRRVPYPVRSLGDGVLLSLMELPGRLPINVVQAALPN